MVLRNCEASLVVILTAMTGLETPHARPKAILLSVDREKTKRYL